MTNRDDLNRTADGLRDTASELGKEPNEHAIRASMTEEVAIAQHRTAEAIERQNEILEELTKHVRHIPAESV